MFGQHPSNQNNRNCRVRRGCTGQPANLVTPCLPFCHANKCNNRTLFPANEVAEATGPLLSRLALRGGGLARLVRGLRCFSADVRRYGDVYTVGSCLTRRWKCPRPAPADTWINKRVERPRLRGAYLFVMPEIGSDYTRASPLFLLEIRAAHSVAKPFSDQT